MRMRIFAGARSGTIPIDCPTTRSSPFRVGAARATHLTTEGARTAAQRVSGSTFMASVTARVEGSCGEMFENLIVLVVTASRCSPAQFLFPLTRDHHKVQVAAEAHRTIWCSPNRAARCIRSVHFSRRCRRLEQRGGDNVRNSIQRQNNEADRTADDVPSRFDLCPPGMRDVGAGKCRRPRRVVGTDLSASAARRQRIRGK